MVYSKQTWVNGESGGTPLNATRLNHIEDGIKTNSDEIAGRLSQASLENLINDVVSTEGAGGWLVLGSDDPIPNGTPSGTKILRIDGFVPPDPVEGIEIVGAATTATSSSSSASLVINVPSGVEVGDILVAGIRTNGSTSPSDFTASGWIRRGLPFAANSATSRVTGLYTHVVTGTEPASYTFTKTVADSRAAGAMFIVRGADTSTPIAAETDHYSVDGDGSGNINLPAMAPGLSVPCLFIGLFAAEVVSPLESLPSLLPANLDQVVLVPSASGTSSTRTTIWIGSYKGSSLDAQVASWGGSASAGATTGFALREAS